MPKMTKGHNFVKNKKTKNSKSHAYKLFETYRQQMIYLSSDNNTIQCQIW